MSISDQRQSLIESYQEIKQKQEQLLSERPGPDSPEAAHRGWVTRMAILNTEAVRLLGEIKAIDDALSNAVRAIVLGQ